MSTSASHLALPALLLALSAPAAATEIGTPSHKFGLGLSVGYPTGLSAKYYPGGRMGAIEGVVAVDPGVYRAGGLYLHAAYLWHPDTLASEPGFELPFHAGVGGFLWDDYYSWRGSYWGGGTAIGARGQIGLDFDLTDIRLQISLDLALHIGMATGGYLFYDVPLALSVRYFF